MWIRLAVTSVSFVLLVVSPVRAGLITFESIPGIGTPSDGMAINTQFQASLGVTFSLEGGGSPVLAQVGAPQTAFQGFNFLPDQPAPGVDAGSFFLTDDGVVAGPPTSLIITYTNPVAAASGILLDIDGTEAWQIQARNASNAVIDVVNLGPNSLLDGSATPWSFSHGSADIFSIRMVYTGSQTGGVGLAFDNFSPSSVAAVPEPSSLAMLAAGVLSLAAFGRRRRRAVQVCVGHLGRTGRVHSRRRQRDQRDDGPPVQLYPPIIPEPGTLLLLGSGLAGVAAWRRREASRGRT